MYKIKYTYDTGNSFNNEYGLEDFLEMQWNDLSVAKTNLVRIKEHYEMYKELNLYYNRNDYEGILQNNEKKDWFVKELQLVARKNKDEDKPNNWYAVDKGSKKKMKDHVFKEVIRKDMAEYNLKLYTDAGKAWQIHAPWCGYFETLVELEIVDDNSGMKIFFK